MSIATVLCFGLGLSLFAGSTALLLLLDAPGRDEEQR